MLQPMPIAETTKVLRGEKRMRRKLTLSPEQFVVILGTSEGKGSATATSSADTEPKYYKLHEMVRHLPKSKWKYASGIVANLLALGATFSTAGILKRSR